MILSVVICLASFAWLVILLRKDRASLGLPIGYLFALLFIHVPGAIAHIVSDGFLADTGATVIGIRFTAIASACFVLGVWLVRLTKPGRPPYLKAAEHRKFAIFCVVVGLGITYSLGVIIGAPSIGAVVGKAGGIWVLGVLLGLRLASLLSNKKAVLTWLGVMCIYPTLMLLLGGFVSFGSTPVFIVLSSLAVSTKSTWRVGIGLPVVAIVFFTLFLSYFKNRDEIRGAVWGGQALTTRVDQSMNMFRDFEFFDPTNESHLTALDLRLNQNFFVGRSAERIEAGTVDFLKGRSFWEGAIALVPRAIWPSKPVYGGSPKVVMEMTGFIVNESTSFGVGNVMEFYINFGISSLVVGFILLGLLFGWLDRKSALAVRSGDLGSAIVFFLPAAAMIHPNGSLVELTSGGAAAFVAALGWRWLWNYWSARDSQKGLARPRSKRDRKRGGSQKAIDSTREGRRGGRGPQISK